MSCNIKPTSYETFCLTNQKSITNAHPNTTIVNNRNDHTILKDCNHCFVV